MPMKKLITLVLMLPLLTVAQTFTNSASMPIPPNGTELRIPVVVSGLPSAISPSFGLSAVCFDITHQADVNLRIQLESPNGSKITIVDQKGAGGDNFTSTCLQENAMNGWIMTGVAPFLGSYYPLQSLNLFNNSQDPNGTWNFIVTDLFIPADTGSFHFVNLTFSINPPADPTSTSGPCSDTNPGGCQCPDPNSFDCDLLPDITSSALSIMQDNHEYPGHITVGVATPNIGWGPLEIHGIQSCFCDTVQVNCSTTLCPNGNPPTQLVNQRIYHKNANTMSYYDRPAGTMSYHPSHQHIHVDNWLDYTLRTWSPDPDERNWPIVGNGTKMSFCLINLSDCDSWYGFCEDTLGNVLTRTNFPNADFGHVSGCSNDQGIYVGNIDEYNSGLNGDGIIAPDVCNQTYYIVAITDPLDNFIETNELNNWAAVPITLTQQNPGTFETSGFTYAVNGNTIQAMSNGTTSDSCVWVWGDGSSNTYYSTQASHTYTGNGDYVVFHYAYNHCGPTVSADTIHILNTGLNTLNNPVLSLSLAPNPARDKAVLDYTLVQQTEVSIQVLDSYGKLIRDLQYGIQLPGKYRVAMPAHEEGLTSGIYYVRVNSNHSSQNIRWIIM